MDYTLSQELNRTVDMLIKINKTKYGLYYCIAFLHDSNYDIMRINLLLPILLDKVKKS